MGVPAGLNPAAAWIGTCGFVIAVASAAAFGVVTGSAAWEVELSERDATDLLITSGRYSYEPDRGILRLRGSGAALSRQPLGPGEYHIRFALHEPEKFQYHRAQVALFVQDPETPGSDGYYLQWDPSGIITCRKVFKGESTLLNTFIRGGRDNPNRFEADEYVDLALRVPEEGDGVYLYCGRTRTSGEPTTAFKLSDLPLKGHFGAFNSKWHSHMTVQRMRYRPGAAESDE